MHHHILGLLGSPNRSSDSAAWRAHANLAITLTSSCFCFSQWLPSSGPQSYPALADISQLLLQHHPSITGVHEDMDYILMTYFRHLIWRVAIPENQMPCSSPMTREQRLLSCSVGNPIHVIKCLFLPLFLQVSWTWNILPPPGRKHWFLAGLHWSLVQFHTSACWERTQKFRHSSDRSSSHSDYLPLHNNVAADPQTQEEET